MPDRVECVKEEQVDQENTDRHNDRESLHRALLILKLSSPGKEVSGRKRQLCSDALLHLVHDGSHVSPPDKDPNRRDSHAGFTADIHAAAANAYRGYLLDRYAHPRGGINQDVLDRIEVLSLFLAKTNHDAKAFFTLPNLGRGLPSQRRFDGVLNILDVKPVACSALAIYL